jgi:hypothetical protein
MAGVCKWALIVAIAAGACSPRTAPTTGAEGRSDLPSRAQTLAITRRAMAQLRAHDGFLPAIAQVDACYRALTRSSPLEQRIFCLQLDALAYGIESDAPLAWRRADDAANPYFTSGQFYSRQRANMPPLSGDNIEQRKDTAIAALAAVGNQVLAEEVAP